MRKSLLSLSLITVLLAGCSDKTVENTPATSSAPSDSPPVSVQKQADSEVIFLEKKDLTGDGKLETVSLRGLDKENSNQTAFKRLQIRVEGEGWNQEALIESESPVKPLDLAILDLTADGHKEIAVKTDRGSTGKGIVQLTLFTVSADRKLEEMKFDNSRNPEFRLRLLNTNQYELLDPLLNKAWKLQLEEEKVAATGNPGMSGQRPEIDLPYEWNWTDADNDGKIDLISRRAVWIASHSNMLFDVQTVYKWDGKVWKPQGYTLIPEKGVKIVN
ncbi:hypothetical protein [Effusibacillus consociatus]|uniref:Lipoprotein n=1 Tax=Effusibacillus consociatus TaxID=1117041 RepID=A0ABV9Q814_9BACL